MMNSELDALVERDRIKDEIIEIGDNIIKTQKEVIRIQGEMITLLKQEVAELHKVLCDDCK